MSALQAEGWHECPTWCTLLQGAHPSPAHCGRCWSCGYATFIATVCDCQPRHPGPKRACAPRQGVIYSRPVRLSRLRQPLSLCLNTCGRMHGCGGAVAAMATTPPHRSARQAGIGWVRVEALGLIIRSGRPIVPPQPQPQTLEQKTATGLTLSFTELCLPAKSNAFNTSKFRIQMRMFDALLLSTVMLVVNKCSFVRRCDIPTLPRSHNFTLFGTTGKQRHGVLIETNSRWPVHGGRTGNTSK